MGQMLKKQAQILSEIAAFAQPAQLGQNNLYMETNLFHSQNKSISI